MPSWPGCRLSSASTRRSSRCWLTPCSARRVSCWLAASLAPLAGGDSQRYLALVPTLALMAGALYVVAGLCRLGFIANFLSQPILTGYLNGIAAIIIVGQLPKLVGYPGAAQEFMPRLLEF